MAYRIEGYAIISADGMLADAAGVIPPALIVPADQGFSRARLDASAAVVHGRNSAEQPRVRRRRVIATRRVPCPRPRFRDTDAVLWNPAGASFEQALQRLGVAEGKMAIIGGTEIFGLFLPRYDAFHLSRVAGVRLPGGRPVFPQVPAAHVRMTC